MVEIAIKFFGREVTLRPGEGVQVGVHVAKLGPALQLMWGSPLNQLALYAGAARLSPAAGGDTAQRAAEILEDIYRPMRALFEAETAAFEGPVPMALHCPKCSTAHVDTDEECAAGIEHRCALCGHEWHPFDFETVGVASAEGQHEVEVMYLSASGGDGWYWQDDQLTTKGAFGTFEAAARDALDPRRGLYYGVRPPALLRPEQKVEASGV